MAIIIIINNYIKLKIIYLCLKLPAIVIDDWFLDGFNAEFDDIYKYF